MTSLIIPGANAEQMQAFNSLQRAACSPQVAAHLGRTHAEYDATADLPRVRCPALIFHSPDDRPVPFEEGRMIASMIPGARLVPFASANHTPLPTEPAFGFVNRLIDEFVLGTDGVQGREGRVVEASATGELVDAHALLRVVGGARLQG
jgi:pimeloyl-ACP methyl ester carboxylesterase